MKSRERVLAAVKHQEPDRVPIDFGGIKAVNGVDLKLYEGEITAIVGNNGAGKSTLIKTISGVYKKTSGQIYVNGKEVDINSTLDSRRYGIETVYQSEGALDSFDAPANLFLGRLKPLKIIFGLEIHIIIIYIIITAPVIKSIGNCKHLVRGPVSSELIYMIQ